MVGKRPEWTILGLRFVGDVFFALFSRLVPKMASALLFIILMRRSGASVAGAYSLSTAFLTTGVLLSSLGLEELIVREVAKGTFPSRGYLLNILFIRGILSLLGYGIVAVIVTGFLHYDMDVKRIILIQSLGMFPESLSSAMFAVFNATGRLKWVALVSVCVSAFQLSTGGLALWMGAGLELVIWLLLGGSLLGVVVSVCFSVRLVRAYSTPVGDHDVGQKQPQCWRLDWAFCRQQLRLMLPFALTTTLSSLDLQLDVIVLSTLRSIDEVGIYSAARAVMLLLSLLPQAFRMSLYPSMAKAHATSEQELRNVYVQSWWYLTMVGLPLAAGGIILSRPIIHVVYGNATFATSWALSILMVHLLVGFLYLPSTRLMVVSDHQGRLSMLLGLGLGINVAMNVSLAPSLGAVGTAIARSVSSALYFIAVELYVSRHLLRRHGGFLTAIKPILATALMVAVVWPLRGQALYVAVPAGVLSYGLALFMVGGVHPPGVFRQQA